jgi:hypothetical protein
MLLCSLMHNNAMEDDAPCAFFLETAVLMLALLIKGRRCTICFVLEALPEITMVHTRFDFFAVAVAPESTQEGKFSHNCQVHKKWYCVMNIELDDKVLDLLQMLIMSNGQC